jgi:hypothetical protein
MNPTLGSAKVDKILTQFSQMYRNDTYIAEQVLPVLKVKEKSGQYAKYNKENLRAYVDNIYRAPGTRAHTVDYSVSQGTYTCREHAIEKRVPDEFKNNTDNPYDAKRDATAVIMDNIWVNQELALATTMRDATVLTSNTTLSGTDQWSDYANSDPIGDIETGIAAVRSLTAKRPNTAVMGHDVWLKLKYHPDVREQVKYTGNGRFSDAAFGSFIKEFFSLDNVFVGAAIYDTAVEGQTASLSDIWTKDFWLLYQNKRPTLMSATFGYTLSDTPRYVDQYREESTKSDVVRVQYSYDQNIFDVNLAYLINDAIA